MRPQFVFAAVIAAAGVSHGLTGEEILRRMDRNRDHTSVMATGRMEIHVGDETRVKTMKIQGLTEGSRSMVEFTNAEDRGTKYLMIGENLWIYFPEEQDVVKISGHMLKEGMMGSDVSYEDALESDRLTDKYNVTMAGQENWEGHPCHVIELNATVKDVPYYRRKMWVDTTTYVAWKEEMYAKSGKLLKESRVLKVDRIGGREFPVESEMVNTLRRNSKTVFVMSEVQLDVRLDENEFSMRYLRR